MNVGLVSAREKIIRRFERDMPDKVEYIANYNIHQDSNCLFISTDKPTQFTAYSYGMIPYNSKEPRKYYQAPVENANTEHREGILRKDIILDTHFRKAIRNQRGILPVDYFIVPGKDDTPFLVFSPDRRRRPIALACIWDCWKKEITDELTYGFAILTIPAFGIFKEAGIEYLPVVLDDYQYRKWVKTNLSLTEVTEMLVPIPKTELNAFPVSKQIWYNKENNKQLIASCGKLLIQEKPEPRRPILDKFQRKKFHDNDPGFQWGYMKMTSQPSK